MKFEIKKVKKEHGFRYKCLFCNNTAKYSVKILMDVQEPFKVPIVCGIHMNKLFRKLRNLFEWEVLSEEADNQVAEKTRRRMVYEHNKAHPEDSIRYF